MWSQLPESASRILHDAPIKALAFHIAQAVSTLDGNGADVSVVCADVLPTQTSWQDVLRRQAERPAQVPGAAAGGTWQQQAPPPQAQQQEEGERGEEAAGVSPSRAAAAGRKMLRMLGFRRATSEHSLSLTAAPSGADSKAQRGAVLKSSAPPSPLPPPTAKLLIDVDVAALMGLVPPPACHGGEEGPGEAAGGSLGGEGLEDLPIWWTEGVHQELETALVGGLPQRTGAGRDWWYGTSSSC